MVEYPRAARRLLLPFALGPGIGPLVLGAMRQASYRNR